MTAVQLKSRPVSSGTVAEPTMPRLRVTRRGRIVIGALVLLPLIAAFVAFAALGTTSAEASSAAGAATTSFTYVTVVGGQDLWGVAQSLEPTGDIRDVVADIVNLSQLESSSVQPGQRLAIPAAYAR
jgi:hypothetical protein